MSGKRATAAQPILFRTFPGDTIAVVDQSGVTPPNGSSALLKIENCDHVTVQDIEFRNYKTTSTSKVPIGIWITGDGTGVKLLGCKVNNVWQSNTTLKNLSANGFGVLVSGNAPTPIDGFVMNGCEIHTLRTGASESVALNGNVTNFAVTNNLVHDCNNIGIDFIGFEDNGIPEAVNQARNGSCSGNVVWNIDSKINPAYGGNFGSGGGNGTRAAPGLYVDGGRDILLERNHVHSCNIAVSVGSEHQGKASSGVVVRNNVLHHCHVGGIFMGGSGVDNGGATDCTISHNTLYRNDTVGFGGGQFSIQNHVSTTTIRHNIMVCSASLSQFVLKTNTTGSFDANAINWNLYSGAPATDVEFIWNTVDTRLATFTEWKTSSAQDTNSFFTASLGLVAASPAASSPVQDFYLAAASSAVNAGDPTFVPAGGEKDHAGQSRIASDSVDIGADELLSPWQAWRDTHFTLPDGGPNAGQLDDPDGDGVPNLIEFSQGALPLTPDTHRLPTLAPAGAAFRFSYRKDGPGLTYLIEQSTTLGTWTNATPPEQTDGLGAFWRDFTAEGPLFIRLRVEQF